MKTCMTQEAFNALIERCYALSPSTTDDLLEQAIREQMTQKQLVALLRSIIADFSMLY